MSRKEPGERGTFNGSCQFLAKEIIFVRGMRALCTPYFMPSFDSFHPSSQVVLLTWSPIEQSHSRCSLFDKQACDTMDSACLPGVPG